ncbi:MAG: BMP family ABC transporter substrate-binding protein [Chloroflexota bacterium]|jgi:basic membrane protein A
MVSRSSAWLMAALLIASGVSACAPQPDCRREEVFCAGLVTDTRGLNDFGLTQHTWAGLERALANGTADHIAYIESVDRRDYEKNIAFFVEEGYDVIVTAGIGLEDAALHSADLNPDSTFIGVNQPADSPPPNFIPVTFPEDQMGFLAGALAARLTRSKTVGAVCEASGIDAMWRYCEGFRAGAKYADKTVKVIVVYRDSGSRSKLFNDPDWGSETAAGLIQQGADVIFAAGGETAAGALRAANSLKALAIGVERDQAAALGEEGSRVAASIVGGAGSTVEALMRKVREGNPPAAQIGAVEVMASGEIIPNSLVLEVNEILSGLKDGRIKTNVTFEKP